MPAASWQPKPPEPFGSPATPPTADIIEPLLTSSRTTSSTKRIVVPALIARSSIRGRGSVMAIAP
ncbi:hypothetical protein [Streptomyces sp. CB02959]|uniref:hypothetical protein n=1 Tax=Streptomyces sp. CB02959 TaxID=2020330 RepID=UPI0021539152|nr:hypothetical protein [Streptomyces sp. CB02959]